jgi:hypothetical protein
MIDNIDKLTSNQKDFLRGLYASMTSIPNKTALEIRDYYVEEILKLNNCSQKSINRKDELAIEQHVQQTVAVEQVKSDARRKELMNQIMTRLISVIRAETDSKEMKKTKEIFFDEVVELCERPEYEDLMDYYLKLI